MPQAANLVLKNNALVDKTFTLLTPASGDDGLAEWALKEGGSPVAYARATALARKTANDSRQARGKFKMPHSYTDTATSLVKAGPAAEFNFTSSIPDSFPESMRPDYVAYVVAFVANTIIKEMIRDGYPAV